MKVSVSTGGGMSGLAKYMNKIGSQFICSSTLTDHLPDFLRETAMLRQLRPDCKKPVLQFSLSQPPGEPLAKENGHKLLIFLWIKWDSFITVI